MLYVALMVNLSILDFVFHCSLQVIFLLSTPSRFTQRPCLALDTALAHLSASSWWRTSSIIGIAFCQVGVVALAPRQIAITLLPLSKASHCLDDQTFGRLTWSEVWCKWKCQKHQFLQWRITTTSITQLVTLFEILGWQVCRYTILYYIFLNLKKIKCL